MTGLRNQILGCWELTSFTSQEVDTGALRHPLGTEPRGLIIYHPDGYMSAQLSEADLSGYIAYGGPFHVDEETSTVHHAVTISSRQTTMPARDESGGGGGDQVEPELLTQPQYRHAAVSGDLLTLSANTTDDNGTTTNNSLVWKRVTRVAD